MQKKKRKKKVQFIEKLLWIIEQVYISCWTDVLSQVNQLRLILIKWKHCHIMLDIANILKISKSSTEYESSQL